MDINHKTHCETGILYEDIKEFLNIDFKITNLSYDGDKKILSIVQNPNTVVSCSMKELPNRNQIVDLTNRIRNEITRAMASERDLGIKIQTESDKIKTYIEEIQKRILDSINTLKSDLDYTNTSLADEIIRAKAEEKLLSTRIAALEAKYTELTQGLNTNKSI